MQRNLITNEKEKRLNTLNDQRRPKHKKHSQTKSLNFSLALKAKAKENDGASKNVGLLNLKSLTHLVNKINDSKFKLQINQNNIKEINNIIVSARGFSSRGYSHSFISATKRRENALNEKSQTKLENLVYRQKDIIRKNCFSLSNLKNENLNKNKNEFSENENDFIYYTSLMSYFLRNPDDEDYFNTVYREHFLQSFASFKFCSNIQRNELKDDKKIELGSNPKSIIVFLIKLYEILFLYYHSFSLQKFYLLSHFWNQ